MNMRTITSAVISISVTLLLTACSTSRSYPDNRRDYPGYPYPDGRYPDGRHPSPDGRYPDGRTYPTSRYPNRMPPGHAKKIYGQKSAKVFAPGQQKKYTKNKKGKSKRKY